MLPVASGTLGLGALRYLHRSNMAGRGRRKACPIFRYGFLERTHEVDRAFYQPTCDDQSCLVMIGRANENGG